MHSFVDELKSQNLNRKKIRQIVKESKNNSEPLLSKNNSDAVSDAFTNEFVSSNKDFVLKIHFKNLVPYNKNKVLRALKEVFEKTKNE